MRRALWWALIRIFYAARNRWPIGAEIVARVAIGAWIINKIVREAESKRA